MSSSPASQSPEERYGVVQDVLTGTRTCTIAFEPAGARHPALIVDPQLDQPFNDYVEADRLAIPIRVLVARNAAGPAGQIRIVGTAAEPWTKPMESTPFDEPAPAQFSLLE